MEMNPFKPLAQHFQEIQEKVFTLKTSINKLYLKIILVKATT